MKRLFLKFLLKLVWTKWILQASITGNGFIVKSLKILKGIQKTYIEEGHTIQMYNGQKQNKRQTIVDKNTTQKAKDWETLTQVVRKGRQFLLYYYIWKKEINRKHILCRLAMAFLKCMILTYVINSFNDLVYTIMHCMHIYSNTSSTRFKRDLLI
jgi:hypothetical protein